MTNLDPIVRVLREQLPELEILEYEPMRAHCSFRIGGPARALVRPASAEETAAVCRIVRDGGAQPLLIGNGTNLLITDGDVDRIVVQMGERMADVARTDATHLRAGAGIPLARLAQAALGYGLAGLEFAHGIPGSLGGAVSMNAGAYGGEMKDVVVSTRYLDHDLNLCEAVGAAHDFGYRHRPIAINVHVFILIGFILNFNTLLIPLYNTVNIINEHVCNFIFIKTVQDHSTTYCI